ncbi:MAG: T9SS type A sorting domain-containing protein, partial [Ignavibacteria bacterium]|nr:T9SS type A sorting domain-containing protein [Ignavibacteria bacterium]
YGLRNVKWQKDNLYGYEYVIICPNVPIFLQWADSIRNFRIAQGITTGIFTLTQIGGNNATLIKTFLTNAWNNWGIKPVAVLMLGDYNPPDANNSVTSPIYNSYCVSDNILGDIDNNQLPDIVMARMTAQDATQLQTMITKFIDYEKKPPNDANFYYKPITALGWQTERWFQICSETVGGFWKKKMGKLPTRINAIYSGSPTTTWSTATNTATVLAYFGPAGRYYIPATPDSLGGWSGGTAAMVVTALNNGAFALQHRDHGGENGWGEPAFTNSNIDQLTNVGKLSFIFSINCLTGKYNWTSECFAEKFHRYKYSGQNAGALGIIAASEVSYSFVNDTYVWGMMDNFWPQFMPDYGSTPASRDFKPAFGNAAGKYFLYASSWPYNTSNKEVTYHLFHHHSDAFLNVYANVPTNLSVTHASTISTGVTTFDVTADSGTFIALSIDTTILGTGTSTGTTLSINIPGTQIPPQIMKVVATKQDKYRYMADVQVIPNTGPYVVKDSVGINDAVPLGNGNGLMDYGETNKLNFRVKNVGSVNASNVNVKVTSADPYVTITDSTENYGTINAGATKLINDAFTYTVSPLIPDNRMVTFNYWASDGTNVWTSTFGIQAHAPIIDMGSVTINDSAANNNGRWDPGETVMLRVEFKNIGTSNLLSGKGKLVKNSSYVTLNTDSVVYGDINAGSSVIKQFSATSQVSTPVGHAAQFFFTMYANLINPVVDTFAVVIGQNVFTIGNGTTSSGYPYYTYYMDARTQMLYTASELTASGLSASHITHIGFDVISASSQTMQGFKIRMQNTSATSLTAFVTSGFTTVRELDYTVPGTGWQDVNLINTFYWNGTSNLLIEICFNNASYTSNTTVNATSMSSMCVGKYADLSSGDGCTQTTINTITYRPNLKITIGAPNAITNANEIPTTYSLSQNYPNPFNPVTKINFAIPKQGFVSLKVFDILGREVANLVNEVKSPGNYVLDFNASHLASGVYYYKLESADFTDIKKMVLIK